ncbi:DUF748 domain-containing protein [Vibrio salinus]|uniref:DUF748 domain-containing protein n=1 Tax=Vibrio salinus TaxID=2899784 RepID=UPI001E37B598|nr:DUF748 domain-containing protein [Vibrio salinus]MCE0495308.1 DUF748 domain-containing protein [Vibrio salinus]
MKDSIRKFYQKFKKLPGYARITTYFVLTYAVFLLLIGVISPLILEKQIPEQLSTQTGRSVSLQKISINPFLLRVTVNNFKISQQKSDLAFVRFKQLQFEPLFWKSVFTLTPTLDYMTLSTPKINLSSYAGTKGNTVFSFQDIINNLEKQKTSDSSSSAPQTGSEIQSSPFAFKANKITIAHGSVTYNDKSKSVTFQYPDINFSLNNINTLAPIDRTEKAGTSTDKLIDFNWFALSIKGIQQHLIDITGRFQLYPLKIDSGLSVKHFGLPSVWPYAQDYINGQLKSGKLDFSTQILITEKNQTLNFSTKNGQLALSDLLLNTHQSKPVVSLANLKIAQISADSTKKAVQINSVQMDKFIIRSELEKNGIDLTKLYKKSSNATDEPSIPASSNTKAEPSISTDYQKSWLVILNKFKMSDSQFSVIDNAIAKKVKWHLNPVNIQLTDIRSDLATPIKYSVNLGLFSTTKTEPKPIVGNINGQGLLNSQQQTINGNIKITNIDLSDIQPYLKPYVNIDLIKGQFSTEGKLEASFTGDNLKFAGNIGISHLHINDKLENKPFLTWSDMAIHNLAYNQKKSSLSIDSVTFTKPYSKVLIDKKKNTNINDILKNSTQETKAKPASKVQTESTKKKHNKAQADKKLRIAINKILIKDGSAYFADQSLTPHFASGINSINGYIGRLTSSANTAAKVDLKGKLDKYAPIKIQGEINPLLNTPYLNLVLDIKGAELTSVNPYSGTYAGYYIDKGQMSLTLNYWLKQNQLKGSNHIYIDQLQLGKPSNSKLATSLPVKLAIALLQDRNGVIDLGVNVSGDINDPSFGIGSVVLTAIKNIIVKAVTAPFSLLANLIGSDEQLNVVQYAPGTAELESEEKDRLSKLAKALTERPKLKLSVEGHVAKNQDAIALAEIQFKAQLQKSSGLPELPEDLTASRLPLKGPLIDSLTALYIHQFGDVVDTLRDSIESQLKESEQDLEVSDNEIEKRLHITMYNQLVNAQNVSEEALTKLAYSRASNVKTYLVNSQGIDPQRVFLLNSRLGQKEDKAEATIALDN